MSPCGGLFTASRDKVLPGKGDFDNLCLMSGDRIARATARIEAAARRIEAAAQRPSGGSGGDPDLTARYQALRGEAAAALAELDALIGSLEG